MSPEEASWNDEAGYKSPLAVSGSVTNLDTIVGYRCGRRGCETGGENLDGVPDKSVGGKYLHDLFYEEIACGGCGRAGIHAGIVSCNQVCARRRQWNVELNCICSRC